MPFTRRPHIMPSGITTISGTVETSPVTPGQQSMVDSAPVVIASDQTALPLSPGAATAARQPALGTAGSPSSDVLSVQGVKGGTVLPICLPASSRAEISQAEQMRQLVAIGQATLHVLTQILAFTQGRTSPLRGEEGDSLVAEFLDCRTITSIVN